MPDAVRLLTPRKRRPATDGKGAPRGPHLKSQAEREALQEYLQGVYLVDPTQAAEDVETLSIAERTVLEIDMRDRSEITHSFDYDPLRI